MADNSSILKSLDRRIRASLAYTNWVTRNKGPLCLRCGKDENLECHHLVDLYHVILGLWRFYGDPEEVFNHIIDYHEHDKLEGITLCSDCHKLKHPGRILSENSNQINTDLWSVIPRMLKLDPNHSVKPRQGAIGLIAYQTLFGIGWNLLNDHVDARMLTINRRRFAELLDKTPSTSFNASLEAALVQLEAIGVLCGHCSNGNDIEMHLSSEYLDMIEKNPWFVRMNDTYTNSMCVLCIRLWLGMQSKRHTYAIGLDKLKGHIGMTVKDKSSAIAAIQKAVKQIPWAKVEVKESLQFGISRRPPTPIRSLRAILTDVLVQAK